jgi:hypothetical protein
MKHPVLARKDCGLVDTASGVISVPSCSALKDTILSKLAGERFRLLYLQLAAAATVAGSASRRRPFPKTLCR